MSRAFSEILAAFSCPPNTPVAPLGKGNINDTYLVQTLGNPFVLQKISAEVFPDPIAVIANFEVINNHLARQKGSEGVTFVMAAPIYTKSGSLSFTDSSGGYWRAQSYIESGKVQIIETSEQARSIGSTLARFHRLFSDLHLADICDPLPGFHNLSLYLDSYDKYSGNSSIDYEDSLSFCHSIVTKYRHRASTVERARERGEFGLQPVHGDPKLDNFIFDRAGRAVGLLDLDTVGAGLVYHDLGDCLRSVCATSGESVLDLRTQGFDLNLCELILDGYLSLDGFNNNNLNPELIYNGLMAICFELGLRFFTDHLQGNIYFKTDNDGENLQRAKKQFQLTLEVVEQENSIKKMIDIIFKKHMINGG